MFLLDSARYNADANGVVSGIHAMFEKHKGEILISRPWDERRLMYSVAGQKKCTYYLIYVKIEGRAFEQIGNDFSLYDPILRHLIIKIHPKLVDAMLNVARDEHAAIALHAPGLSEEVEGVPVAVDKD